MDSETETKNEKSPKLKEEMKKEVVSFFISKGILITEDLLEGLSSEANLEEVYSSISKNASSDLLVINKDIKEILCKGKAKDMVCKEFEKSVVLAQKYKKNTAYDNLIEVLKSEELSLEGVEKKKHESVKITNPYEEENKKREIQDFVALFNARYSAIEKILRQRAELQNIFSIGRVLAKKDKETISIIGLVTEKRVTKNNNLIISLEDNTGTIKVLINKNKPQFYEQCKDLVLDEVIGVVGVNGENIIFANQVVWPDIPAKSLKKSDDEAHAVFLSDIHVGSDTFLGKELERFLQWIKGESGNEEQRALAQSVQYVFIVGDLVDGVGIYPGQEKDLVIKDIYKQYEECARYLREIPDRIKVIICPGNHDAMRIAEPQPELYKDLAKPIWDLKNVIMVTNPSTVTIHSSEDFSGFDVLLYHGYSFDYYFANVDSIRNGGGYDRADLIMKFLLQRRHLAPTHTSTLYIPHPRKDSLVIEKVPDFFVTGHIHKTAVANYKGVTMISGSCWQSTTAFQEKVGHHPEPCRVPIVNLKTRNVKILKFG